MSIATVQVLARYADEEIIDLMRQMKAARQSGQFDHIVCVLGGYDDDPRELRDIPEAQALCRRLVGMGFISQLDVATALDPELPKGVKAGLGAFEIWLCGEGRLGTEQVTVGLIDELMGVIARANVRADEQLAAHPAGDSEVVTDRYASPEAWSKALGVPLDALRERLRGTETKRGTTNDDPPRVTDFYAESDVLLRCEDLIPKGR